MPARARAVGGRGGGSTQSTSATASADWSRCRRRGHAGRGREGRRPPGARQPSSQRELGRRGMCAHPRDGQEVVEAEHAEGPGMFQQRVQDLGGRSRVGVGAVYGLDRRAEMARQRLEAKVRHVVARQPPGERDRIHATVSQTRVAERDESGVEERHVEANVVADDHGVARELQERRQYLGDARRGEDHGFGDAGEHRDHRRDRHAGVHERLQAAEQLAAAQLQRADLGDRVAARRATCGLEVDDDERHVEQRRAEIHTGSLPNICSPRKHVRISGSRSRSLTAPASSRRASGALLTASCGCCCILSSRGFPVSLRRVRQRHPFRRRRDPANARVPSLLAGRRARDRGGGAARRADRAGDVPVVRRVRCRGAARPADVSGVGRRSRCRRSSARSPGRADRSRTAP